VKRNRSRFPPDFMFRLTRREKEKVVTACDHLARLKFSPTLPYAFTEHGAIMVATILNSVTAIAVSLQVVRTFVRFREILSSHVELARRLDDLEKRHDRQLTQIFAVLRELLEAPSAKTERKRIGFSGEERA
jgi:ORF6N domain